MHEVCSALAQPKACPRVNRAYLGRMSLALMFTLSASLQHLSIHVSNRNSVALRLHMRVRLTTVCPLSLSPSLPPAPIKATTCARACAPSRRALPCQTYLILTAGRSACLLK